MENIMKKYVTRTNYLSKIREFREQDLIKVVTGIRRCGKSVLMEQFQEELKSGGIKNNQIISINFEELENEELLDYKKLHDYIRKRLNKNGWTYVFLDEIQMVKDFQKTISSLRAKKNVDIYITGSNSYLLSGELATLLSGRYILIHLLPLSFKEYCEAFEFNSAENKNNFPSRSQSMDVRQIFNNYLKFGSFPQTLKFKSQRAIYSYLDSIYNTVVVKDICGREKTVDVGILASIAKFIFHNIGNLVSATTIADTLTSNKRKTSYNTVEKYLGLLKDSFIIYELSRYDVKGKQHLKQNAKYYSVDIGLRNMLLANKETDIGHVLENLIYLELLRREYKVSVGKFDNKEIDFVAENENGIEYYQVAASVLDKNTLERELESLNKIQDHFPKYIITLDEHTPNTSYNGIKIINAIDFLMG